MIWQLELERPWEFFIFFFYWTDRWTDRWMDRTGPRSGLAPENTQLVHCSPLLGNLSGVGAVASLVTPAICFQPYRTSSITGYWSSVGGGLSAWGAVFLPLPSSASSHTLSHPPSWFGGGLGVLSPSSCQFFPSSIHRGWSTITLWVSWWSLTFLCRFWQPVSGS